MLWNYRRILKNYEENLTPIKIRVIQGITVMVIAILLSVTRVQQNNYIDEYETPPIIYCIYYDQYGNYIHGSRISYVCPDIKVEENTPNNLHLTFAYKFHTNSTGYSGKSIDDEWLYRYRKVNDGYIFVDIEVHYLEEGIIDNIHYKESVNYIALDYMNEYQDRFEQGEITPSDYDQKVANDSYILTKTSKISSYNEAIIHTDYNDEEIIQTKSIYKILAHERDFSSIDDILLHEVTEDDLTRRFTDTLSYSLDDNKITYDIVTKRDNQSDEESVLSYVGEVSSNNGYIKLFHETNFDTTNGDYLADDINDEIYFFEDGKINYFKTVLSSKETNEYHIDNQFSLSTIASTDNYKLDSCNNNGCTFKQTSLDRVNLYEYKNTSFISSKFYTYKVAKTSFGYTIEQYGQDGVTSDKDLPLDSYFLEYSFMGLDYQINDYSSAESYIYRNIPIFSMSSSLKYLIETFE